MPGYNPYLLQLPSASKKADQLIGYATAVLSKYIGLYQQVDRKEVIHVLNDRRYAVELHKRLGDIADEMINEIGKLYWNNLLSPLLNDLRRLGIIDVYRLKSKGVEYLSPDESDWRSGYARLGPNSGPAVSALRRCLSIEEMDVHTCLRFAAAVAALSFLYRGGGSAKLRSTIRMLLSSRDKLDAVIKDIAEKTGSKMDNARQKVIANLEFFENVFAIVRSLASARPGLVPPGYLRVIEALGQG